MSTEPRGGLKLLGLTALACVGCCAGPILAFLGGLGIAGLASTTFLGGAGLIITAAAATGYVIMRRRRTSACATTRPDAGRVATPLRRAPTIASDEVPIP